MNLNHIIFNNGKAFLPVVHVLNKQQTLENIKMLVEIGVKGCFIISHGHKNYKELIALEADIKSLYPAFWVGINFLDIECFKVFLMLEKEFRPTRVRELNGIWIDNSYEGIDHEKENKRTINSWKKSAFKGLYFGGVAFKGCDQPKNLVGTMEHAIHNMSVVTTSGTRTGSAPDLKKIKTMKAVADQKPLAIASGITTKNIEKFIPYADIFMVASGIEDSFGELNRAATEELFNKIKDF